MANTPVSKTQKRPKSMHEVISLRHGAEFGVINSMTTNAINNPYSESSVEGISRITDVLMKRQSRYVKYEASDALYYLLNSTSDNVAKKAECEIAKAIKYGDDYTKDITIRCVRKAIMADSNGTKLDSETIASIEEARYRGRNILRELFVNEDNKTKELVDSLILKGMRSSIPNVSDAANSVINPYLNGSQNQENAQDLEKFRRLQARAKFLKARSLSRAK
jgi:hypothetical protein